MPVTNDFSGAKKGGGGSGGGRIQVAPDNLRSTDSMEAILGLCEGPIAGLVDGPKTFFLNDTPLLNENGELNFQGAQLAIYNGEPVQGPITPILGGMARTRNVNTPLKAGIPVVRRIVGGRLDFVDLRFVVNSLHNPNYPENDKSQAAILVEWKEPHHTQWYFNNTVTIIGKTTASPFVREARFPVFVNPGDKVRPNELELRVTLLTHDSQEVTVSITWESFQEVQALPARGYENTAIAHFFATASNQFTSLPELSGVYKCMLVRVPSNYDPIAKTYSGVWNGSFKIAWTDNPAWCLYDFIMNDRYGLNKYGPIVLDKWDTYVAGQWCDELVQAVTVDELGTVVPLVTEPGTETVAPISNSSAQRIAPVTHGAWGSFMNSFAVWASHDGLNPTPLFGPEISFEYQINVPTTGPYTLRYAGDNYCAVFIDGAQVTSAQAGYAGFLTSTVNLTAGAHTVIVRGSNDATHGNDWSSNPGGLAAEIVGVWNTRMVAGFAPYVCPPGSTDAGGGVCLMPGSPGGRVFEPRFTFNGVLQEGRLSWDWVRYLAGTFLGVLYDDLNGVLRLKVPLRQDPVAAFSNETVADGIFSYAFTDINTRYNDLTVAFVNPEMDWLEDRRRVVDSDGIGRHGHLPLEIDAPGCIYPSEAIRRAWYRIQMAKAQKTTVAFQTNRRAAHLRPYDCIEIADAHINDYESARVVERLSGNRVRLSRPVPLPPGAVVRYNVPGVGLSGSVPVTVFPPPPAGGARAVAVTHWAWTDADAPTYAEALKRHAVWVASGDLTPGVPHTLTWEVRVPKSQQYRVMVLGDNYAGLSVDGGPIVVESGYPNVGEATVFLTEGVRVISILCSNAPGGESNPAGVAATIEGIWTTRSPQRLEETNILHLASAIPDTGEEFPSLLIGFNVDGWMTRWLVTKVTEVDGNPDQLQVEAIEDWTTSVIARPEGDDVPSEHVPVPPPSTVPSGPPPGPISTCPSFSLQPDGSIQVNAIPPFRVFSRPAGAGGEFVERPVSGQRILSHPTGAYVFKILPVGPNGRTADAELSPECPWTVPDCPSLVGSFSHVSMALVDASDCNGYDILVSWDDTFDDTNPFAKEFRVTLHRADTDALVAEQRVPMTSSGAVFIRAMLGSPAPRYQARVWAVNTCGQEFGPGVAERDYRLCIQQPCTEWDRPVFKGATERVKVISNANGAITLNANEANNFVLVLTGNVVLSVTGGCAEGVPLKVVTVQPPAGGRTVAFSGVKWRLRKFIPATSSGNAIDKYVLFQYPSPVGWLVADAGRNFGVA